MRFVGCHCTGPRTIRLSCGFRGYDSCVPVGARRSGRNPTMRHLLRSHSVSVVFLKEVFDNGDTISQSEQPDRQATELYAKALVLGDAWEHAARLIGVGDPAKLTVASAITFWASWKRGQQNMAPAPIRADFEPAPDRPRVDSRPP